MAKEKDNGNNNTAAESKSTKPSKSSGGGAGGNSGFTNFLLVMSLGAILGISVISYQALNQNSQDLKNIAITLENVKASLETLKVAGLAARAAPAAAAATPEAPKQQPTIPKPNAAPAAASKEDSASDDATVVLTNENFQQLVRDGPQEVSFVEFYAPWCGHCKKLTPEWAQLAAHFNKDPSSGVLIGKVDATEQKELAEKFGVSGYPTLKLFFKGIETPKEYSGERTFAALKRYIEGQTGPSFVELKTAGDVSSFQEKNSLAVIGFVADADGLDAKMFKNIANDQREKLRFGLVSDARLIKQLDVPTTPFIRFHRDFDRNKPVTYEGSFVESAKILEFLASNSIPFWGELTNENAQSFLATKRPLLVAFLANTRTPGLVIDPLMTVAKKYEGKLTFVYLDNDTFKSHQNRLGLDGRVPAFAVDDYENGWKYPLLKDATPENFDAFLNDYVNGRLESHVRSAPVPESNDEAVKVLVGKNFKELVLDNDKDVLVEFYAPWCGHCKSLEPKYKELAEKLAPVAPNIVIAKMDSTSNDPPPSTGIKVTGFPTIYFFKAGEKDKPKVYNGGREVDGFISYLKENASQKFELAA